jgi:hypothetical protein
MHFFTLIFPLTFLSLCSQRLSVVRDVFSSVFVLFRFWSLDHRVKFFSFFFIFSSPFFILILFFPFCFFPLSLMSCCLASLCHYAISRAHLVASSCNYVVLPLATASLPHPATLTCYLATSSSSCFATSTSQCLLLPRCLSLFGFHCTSSTSNPPPFVASLPCCLVLHSLIDVLCWLVFPLSLLFCREELEGYKSKPSNNQGSFVFLFFFFLCLIFFC